MPDQKISAMPSATPLDGSELVPLVQSGANVQATVSTLTAATYGEIYVAAGATAQTLTNANTFYKVEAFTTDGLSNGVTVAAATDKIVIDKAGDYLVQFFITFTDSNNRTFSFRCYNSTAAAPYVNTLVKSHSHSSDPMFVAVSAFVHADAGDELIVQAACTTGATDITVTDANFAVLLLKAD